MKTMIKWQENPEMVNFMLEIIPGHEESEIRAEFLEKFGIELSESQIGNFKHKYHVKSGTNGGRFKKGQKAHNKGKKVSSEVYERCAPTMFKKGNIPHNHREIGSTRIDTDGYVMIKIAEPNKWQLFQRYVWEKENGRKLLKNECVIFLDGNKENFDPDNLMAIKRSELARVNKNHRITDDPELTRSGVYVERVKEIIRGKS